MKILSNFENQNTKFLNRKCYFYTHKLDIEYKDNEKQQSVIISNLPPGLNFNEATMLLYGVIPDFNSWHTCKDYISKELSDLPDDYIFNNCFKSLDDLSPLSAKDLKEMREIHYSGINYDKFGACAFIKDKHKITHNINIEIQYYSNKKLQIENTEVTLNFELGHNPEDFINDYGKNNELYDQNGNPCSIQEFINLYKKQSGII